MATAMKYFPFTSAQWLELERQALIYKHIIACAPIPTNLLSPIYENNPSEISNSTTTASHSTLGRLSHNTDPEPGRCKRTDGKKWRCSRDVAPDQKYCERHMHRGRPRSRKHVEAQIHEINNNNINLPCSSMSPSPMAKPYYSLTNGFSLTSDFKLPPENMTVSASPYKDIRSMDWMLKRETVPMALSPNQQWEQLMHSKTGSTSFSNPPVFEPRQQQQYQGTLNLNSYTDFNATDTPGTQQQNQNDQFSLFLNPGSTSLNENLSSDQQQTPRSFIDAWSTTKPIETQSSKSSSLSSSFKFSPYNLSLSMSGGNSTTEADIDQIGMGLASKSQTLSGMSSPVSWMSSQPGGPLGEVLQSSTAAITSKSSSINGGGGLNLMTDG